MPSALMSVDLVRRNSVLFSPELPKDLRISVTFPVLPVTWFSRLVSRF